jgi:hypothetical protein
MPAPVVAAAAGAAARAAAPTLFQGFMSALRPALTSGAIQTGFGLMMGESLPMALLYGAADTLGSAGAVAGARAIRPGKMIEMKDVKTGKVTQEYQPSGLEGPANWIGSIGTSNLLSAALGRPSLFNGFQPTGQNAQQQQQQNTDFNNVDLNQLNDAELAQLSDEQILTIMQQNKQREMINQATELAGKYSPGTMFQTSGLPNRQSLANEMMNTNVNANLGNIQQMMGSIVGV